MILKSRKLKEFIEELDVYQNSLYPQELCGFCAVKIFPNYGELKRLFVSTKHRGKGIAKELISRLENYVTNQDIHVLKAETGILQKEAIKLYENLGYKQSDSFGDYRPNSYSIFLAKN